MPVPETRRQVPAVPGRHFQLPRPFQVKDAELQIRRLGDGVIASVFLAFTAPVMLIAALVIKLESEGPILERRDCIGRGGRRFQRLKFRTAMHDPRHAAPAWARRTNPIGQFLRYTRIEDLPQLINVLRGETSLIDPDGSSPTFLEPAPRLLGSAAHDVNGLGQLHPAVTGRKCKPVRTA
jgi:lipopolysaccharide/colanic/teichoic acid biosynthesis glycosyltransferase